MARPSAKAGAGQSLRAIPPDSAAESGENGAGLPRLALVNPQLTTLLPRTFPKPDAFEAQNGDNRDCREGLSR